ncbi:MAG: FHA domain-containing protein [Planctomycetota bacterium]|nr:FHA domain-containing protein [Planctomycetota bacterium]
MPEPSSNKSPQTNAPSLWGSFKRLLGMSPKTPTAKKVSTSGTNSSRDAEEICKDLGLTPPKTVSRLQAPKEEGSVNDEAESANLVVGPTIDDVPCGPFLVHKASKGPVQVLDLAGKKAVTMGRSDRCDFFFVDTAVSRVHMVVELTENGWTLRDMKSTYGSFLEDGTKLYDPHVLTNGQQFRLGRRIEILFVHAADLLKIFEQNSGGISLSSQAA